MLMHLLFSTDFVKIVVRGRMVHLHHLGERLVVLQGESEHVKEFLEELVDGWADYTERLQDYKEKIEGFLYEDPRDVENKNLSGLLGLDQQQTEDGQDVESDFKLKNLAFGVIGAGEDHTD